MADCREASSRGRGWRGGSQAEGGQREKWPRDTAGPEPPFTLRVDTGKVTQRGGALSFSPESRRAAVPGHWEEAARPEELPDGAPGARGMEGGRAGGNRWVG